MKTIKVLIIICLVGLGSKLSAQHLPPSFQPMLNEIVTNFETIRGSNSITKGNNTLSVIDANKIALRIKHNGSIKNLTFETKLDEESKSYWAPANELTIDMVNKYEKDLTKILKSMYKLSDKMSKE